MKFCHCLFPPLSGSLSPWSVWAKYFQHVYFYEAGQVLIWSCWNIDQKLEYQSEDGISIRSWNIDLKIKIFLTCRAKRPVSVAFPCSWIGCLVQSHAFWKESNGRQNFEKTCLNKNIIEWLVPEAANDNLAKLVDKVFGRTRVIKHNNGTLNI